MKLRKLRGLIFAFGFAFLAASCSDGSSSGTTSGSTSGENTLTAPGYFTVTESEYFRGISMEWNGVSGASYYWIYFNTTNDSSSAKLLAKTANSTYYSFTMAGTSQVTWYCWVKAADGNSDDSNTSAFSSVAYFTITDTKPSAPTNITISASETFANQFKVTWNEEKKTFHHWIYYSTTNDSSSATQGSNYPYTIGLVENGTYYFWMKASNDKDGDADATSDFSEAVMVENFVHEDLPTATNPSATGSGNSVTLSWTPATTSSGKYPQYWLIYYGTEKDSSNASYYSTLYSGSQNTANVTIPGDTGTYYFWVRACEVYPNNHINFADSFSNIATYTYSE